MSLLRRFEIPRAARTALIAGLTVAVLFPLASQSIGFNRMISRPSTLEVAYAWIVENVPDGATVIVETGRMRLPPNTRREPASAPRTGLRNVPRGWRRVLIASSEAYGGP